MEGSSSTESISASTSASANAEVTKMTIEAIGEINLKVVEGRNLPSKAYHCVVRLRNQSKVVQTISSAKSTTPRWNEIFTIPVMEIDNEIHVMLYEKKKPYSLGEVIIPLTLFKNLGKKEEEEWHEIETPTSDTSFSGELKISITYKALVDGNKMREEERLMKAIQSNLLGSLESSTRTVFETMQDAVLEEHGVLSGELKRISKKNGKENTSRTVQNLLATLEKTAEELRLKRWMDIQVDDISQCLTRINKLSKSKNSVKSISEIEDDLVVVSNEMNSIIANLQSKQRKIQLESFMQLDDRLSTDSERRSFVHGGGISAAMTLLSSPDDIIVERSLKLLQTATFFESGRAHRELQPVSIVETISGFGESKNKNHRIYASCIITNLLHIKDDSICTYFLDGDGVSDLKLFLESENSFLQLRALWGLSAMPAGDKTKILEPLWSIIVSFLNNPKKPDHQSKAAAIVANFSYDDKNLQFFTERAADFLPACEKFLLFQDERAIEALRVYTNIASSKELRKAICETDAIPRIVQLLSSTMLQMQAAWALGNISMDDRCILAIRNAGAIEALLQVVEDVGTPQDTNEKILWAVTNCLTDDKTKEIVSKHKSGLAALAKLIQICSEKLIGLVLDIFSILIADNLKLSTLLGDLGIMELLAKKVGECRQPHIREKICWSLARLSVGNVGNQDKFRKAGGFTELVDLMESNSICLEPPIWAIFNLIVENEDNLQCLKQLDVICSLVQGLQDEKARDISRKTLAILAADEEQKRQIIDVVVRDVRTRKISFSQI